MSAEETPRIEISPQGRALGGDPFHALHREVRKNIAAIINAGVDAEWTRAEICDAVRAIARELEA